MLESYPVTPVKPLQSCFPHADVQEIDLLSKLLEFSPELRITAEQALKHPWFSGLTVPPLTKFSNAPAESSVASNSNSIVDIKAKLMVEIAFAHQAFDDVPMQDWVHL
jgi:serine/threonine protein kinase